MSDRSRIDTVGVVDYAADTPYTELFVGSELGHSENEESGEPRGHLHEHRHHPEHVDVCEEESSAFLCSISWTSWPAAPSAGDDQPDVHFLMLDRVDADELIRKLIYVTTKPLEEPGG